MNQNSSEGDLPCSTCLVQPESTSINRRSRTPDFSNDLDDSGLLPDTQSRSYDFTESNLCVHCHNALNKWATDFKDTEHEEHPHWNSIAELEQSIANGCAVCGQFLQDRDRSDIERDKKIVQKLGPARVRGTLTFYGKEGTSAGEEPYVVLRFTKSPPETQVDVLESEEDADDVVCHYAVDIIDLGTTSCKSPFALNDYECLLMR